MKLPVIIMLALMPLVLTAYAEAPSHVDVYDYPFNITLLEGGNFTLYNNATNNIYFDGAFEGMVYCGSISGNPDCDGFDNSKTFELPANVFTPDTYYLNDKTYLDTNLISTITIEKPQVIFGTTSSETVGTFESIQPQNNSTDIITSSSVSIPMSDDPIIYIDNRLIDNEEGYIKDGRVYDSNGFDITVDKINPTNEDSVDEIESNTNSTNTEVLNLRLQILKVIESIFKIVLQ